MSSVNGPFKIDEKIHSLDDFKNYYYKGRSLNFYGQLKDIGLPVKYKKDGKIKEGDYFEVINVNRMGKGWKTIEEQAELKKKKKEEEAALAAIARAAATARAAEKQAKIDEKIQEAMKIIEDGSYTSFYNALEYLQDDEILKYIVENNEVKQIVHPRKWYDQDYKRYNFHYGIKTIKTDDTVHVVAPEEWAMGVTINVFVDVNEIPTDLMEYVSTREKRNLEKEGAKGAEGAEGAENQSGGYTKRKGNKRLTKRKRTKSKRNR